MSSTTSLPKSEHQEIWWGLQKCRKCNLAGVPSREGSLKVACTDCNGSGWTKWASFANDPWNEIIPGLYVGGHDYQVETHRGWIQEDAFPDSTFDTVVSMYHRDGYDPSEEVAHHEFLFADSENFSQKNQEKAARAAIEVVDAFLSNKKVLVRCQAGLNRSSLVAAMALNRLGYHPEDTVQLIRERRSPWALCNETFAEFLLDQGRVDQAFELVVG